MGDRRGDPRAGGPPSPVALRRAEARDAARLALVGAASFLESFADDHDGDAVVAHLRATHGEDWYAARLADPAFALWIAEAPLGAPVGYALLGPATLAIVAGQPARLDDLELKRIYMLSRWHGAGHGRALFDAVLAEARARGAARLLLSVYVRNAKARAFYARLGFLPIGEAPFTVGAQTYHDIVLARDV